MKLTNPTDNELNEAFAKNVCKWTVERWPSPDFVNCADAVLIWLDKTYWQVQQTSKANKPLRVRIGSEQDSCFGESDTFPRAAVIALLRAHGVEVEFTQ